MLHFRGAAGVDRVVPAVVIVERQGMSVLAWSHRDKVDGVEDCLEDCSWKDR
jgi:hypothetical protein